MIRKLLFLCFWSVLLPLGAGVMVVILAVIYSKAIIHLTGSEPSEDAVHTMSIMWTGAAMITMAIALLLSVRGLLPGTRLREGSPKHSPRVSWCYRAAVIVALCGMGISSVRDGYVGDGLTLGALVFAFSVAGLTKYRDVRRRREGQLPP